MGRKVITLDNEGLLKSVQALEARISTSGYNPDLIVGIRSGGEIVAGLMYTAVAHASVALRRPSTKAKSCVPRRLLQLLPYWALNSMRRVESIVLSLRKPVPSDAIVELSDAVNKGRRILIVDDACDSGVTLEAVMRSIRQANPTAELRSATVTVTTLRPLVKPDYSLFDNQTLIRFPWSMDYKQR